MQDIHVLIASFPAQGHINPCLRFAERLIRMGIEVTLATTNTAVRCLLKPESKLIKGLNIVSFSDGHDGEGYKHGKTDPEKYMAELKKGSVEGLQEIIKTSAEKGRPITCFVYSILLPWTVSVAHESHIPSALLFIQPATVLSIYYRYFNEYEDEISKNCNDPNWKIQLPGLPSMTGRDLPTFFLASGLDTFGPALTCLHEHISVLDAQENPKVLINTFEGLEPKALRSIEKYKMFPVGPLFPLSLCKGNNTNSNSSGIGQESADYLKWLNSQAKSSVIYISFGSMLILPKKQTEEIAKALLESGRPFLWVMIDDNKKEKLSCLEKLEEQGKIVSWSSQLEVLMNPSLGCFVTHCGWNSTLESITCGVPVVAFPQWTDQTTNAKLLEDVWRTGLRVSPSEDGTVESSELQRCIEIVMDDIQGGEFRRNAMKLKDLARDAMEEGGSTDMNLKAFFQEIKK